MAKIDILCFMRLIALIAALFVAQSAGAQSAASALWTELKAKRESSPGTHQEFEVSRTVKNASTSQSSVRQIVLDMSHRQWREKSVSGSGNYVKVFDGKDLFEFEEGGDEFMRTKRGSKGEDPLPNPYSSTDLDWSKAVELQRLNCGISEVEDVCVVLEAPVKNNWQMNASSIRQRILDGRTRVTVDIETGMLVALSSAQIIDNNKNPYRSEVSYVLKRVRMGNAIDVSLLTPPGTMHEVKKLSSWNAAKIKKELGSKPAPELAVTDMAGNPVTLAAFKGKTVLLDFWTTWCPPCRADAPALEKLYRKYGPQDLVILGISVSEDRAIVEKFLKEHPHSFPVVLTTENEMPRPYQVGAFPTYIVIDRDGTVTSAAEGDQGFDDLRKLLKKAGLEVD